MNASVLLRAQKLEKRFGGIVAARDVSLAVNQDELRCIIGPNGAGKSTLFSLLCGIYRPDAGSIHLKGQDVTTLPAFRRVQLGLGLTFQTNRAYHNLSIRQNLAIPTKMRFAQASEEATARLAHALDVFELDSESELPARELPHHKLQWLEIVMVLAIGPDILLLDEPTAGMSPEETLQTARVLRSLNERGLTIVVVEHDIAFVREVAEVVTVLHQGKVFLEGSVDTVTNDADVRKIYLGRA
jgi:branched-chain amino acid transport system ATP-binding protein